MQHYYHSLWRNGVTIRKDLRFDYADQRSGFNNRTLRVFLVIFGSALLEQIRMGARRSTVSLYAEG